MIGKERELESRDNVGILKIEQWPGQFLNYGFFYVYRT